MGDMLVQKKAHVIFVSSEVIFKDPLKLPFKTSLKITSGEGLQRALKVHIWPCNVRLLAFNVQTTSAVPLRLPSSGDQAWLNLKNSHPSSQFDLTIEFKK